MISDKTKLEKLGKEWIAVKRSQGMVEANTFGGMPLGVAVLTEEFMDLCHNLVLVYACAVLNDVLDQFRKERHFSCNSRYLGALMDESKNHIPWVNFPLVDEGKEHRNDIAHDLKLLPRADCWKYIDAIEQELIAWQVIPGPVKVDVTLTITPTT